jgi:hypothetical protein
MIARSASSLSAARHNVGRITGTGAASDLAEAIAHWDDAWQRDLKANERETRGSCSIRLAATSTAVAIRTTPIANRNQTTKSKTSSFLPSRTYLRMGPRDRSRAPWVWKTGTGRCIVLLGVGRATLPEAFSDFLHRAGLGLQHCFSLTLHGEPNMRLQSISVAALAAMVFLFPAATMAHAGLVMIVPNSQGYNGSWPVTVSHSHNSNFTGCLTLNKTVSGGSAASLVIGTQKYPSGSFLVVNHILVATITAQAYSQNAGLVFIAPASHGNIRKGVFEDVYGGSNFDSGALAFGMKDGC